jgi:hypothetical protein
LLTAKAEQISTLGLTQKILATLSEKMTLNFLTAIANLKGNSHRIDRPSTNPKAETKERATPSSAKPPTQKIIQTFHQRTMKIVKIPIRQTLKSRPTAAQNTTSRNPPNGDANSRNQNWLKQEMQKTTKTKQSTISVMKLNNPRIAQPNLIAFLCSIVSSETTLTERLMRNRNLTGRAS